ncbi:MAG: mRNA surveillance protein pelota [Candidatus Altiarchaeales archaeon]|nr:MAG: mRNA surveillance protein pelota [Candidatus Altiarchaeales archaeon]
MKILKLDRNSGFVHLRIESVDDLWYLSNFLERGDIVRSKTERRVKSKEDIERGKDERVSLVLSINVEKELFDPEAKVLRISGQVSEENRFVPIGSYHTINIAPGSEVKIWKQKGLKNGALKILRDAEKAALKPRILIAVIDDESSCLAVVKDYRIESYDIEGPGSGKRHPKLRSEKEEFYGKILSLIKSLVEKEDIFAIILAGPGFEKEKFAKFLSAKEPELGHISVVENCSCSGIPGVREVLKRPIISKLGSELLVARNLALMESLLREIGKATGLAVYSLDDVKKAAEMGAIDKLLITDTFFKENREVVEEIISLVKNSRGRIHILNSKEEPGKQLSSLGGIAALLRFKILGDNEI